MKDSQPKNLRHTKRLKLVVAYDGCGFAGWQSQKHGNTIQDHVERAFAKICGSRIALVGAGRTDAGVHALGQCAHADVPADKLSAADWIAALNGTLPRTIRILRAQFVSNEFHARFSARGKIYYYRIANTAIMSPFELGRAWHVAYPLNLGVMQQGAALFIGQHDFAGFAANRGKIETDSVRTITSLRIRRRGGIIVSEISGDGFLYKMVRMIVGALVRCALGKEPLDTISVRLDRKTKAASRTHAPRSRFVAPAEGLYLMRVLY